MISPATIPHSTTRHVGESIPRVAFQGERGAYSDEAIEQVWHGCAQSVPARSFVDVTRAVSEGSVEYGMLPIDNTIVGAITAAREALAAIPRLTVLDEITIAIHHALIAPAKATIATLRSVASHPVALAQCSKFLDRHSYMITQHWYDTAGAARDIATRADPYEGAIASGRAAMQYHLQILAEEIQDVPNNYTRFVVVGRMSGDRW